MSSKLNTIAVEIRAHLVTAAQSYMAVGSLLTEARADFQKATEFYKWAEAEVSLKKAMVCKLMQVHKEFGSETDLHVLSYRALATLIGADEEVVEVTKAVVKAGESITEAEIAELKGEEPKAPSKAKESNTLDAKVLDKEVKKLKEANKLATQKAEAALSKSNEAKDKAIKEARTAFSELEAAKATIAQQAARIVELEAALEVFRNAAKAEPVEVPVADEVVDDSDLTPPWEEQASDEPTTGDSFFSDLEEIQDEMDSALVAFAEHYNNLLAVNPRAMVANTEEAAELAGFTVVGKGHKALFLMGNKSYSPKELRATR